MQGMEIWSADSLGLILLHDYLRIIERTAVYPSLLLALMKAIANARFHIS